ncbi:MAG: nucleotidyltransferase domain-containing protein [Lachnospiraceae bacterium]|nr:nucleotidyltransferase domain-containing protein [Lachnospiraceae bacterium]
MAMTLDAILEYVKKKTVRDVPKALSDKCRKIILYGSYARGDYSEDSDVDIAILTDSDRTENQKYNAKLDDIATQIGYKTTAVVNYVCLPLNEFEEKKSWYPYFANIERDGVLLYERT